MNLILQAIKSLFRKIESGVKQAQTTADNAQTTADNAQTTADNALEKILYVTYEFIDDAYITNVSHLEILEHMQNGGIAVYLKQSGNLVQCHVCTSADQNKAMFGFVEYYDNDGIWYVNCDIIRGNMLVPHGKKIT